VNCLFGVGDRSFRLELDGKPLASGADFRFGFEQTATGKDLVIWLNKTLDLNERDEHRGEIAIIRARLHRNEHAAQSSWLDTETKAMCEYVPPQKRAPATAETFSLVVLAFDTAGDHTRFVRAFARSQSSGGG